MNRSTTAVVAVLSAIVLVQGWMLLSRKDAPVAAAGVKESGISAQTEMHVIGRDSNVSDMMKRGVPVQNDTQASVVQPNPIDPKSIAAADRRFASMFPQTQFDVGEMMRLQITIAKLPPEEQVQLMAAFSRAVNSDRIKMRMR